MNRTDRLLAIVLELQGRRHRRAEDLAHTFETSVRTIYRDIRALGQAGVPLIATPGRGYALIEGYFLPPLSFTTDEAAMLLLGSEAMERRFDTQYRAAAQSAGRKIAGVLPAPVQDEVQRLRERIYVNIEGGGLRPEVAENLQRLRQAIERSVTVRFVYHTRHPSSTVTAGTPSHARGADAHDADDADSTHERQTSRPRDADPYALAYLRNAWYLTAYCHLRHDVRRFRLDRMEEVTPLARTFERPADSYVGRRDLLTADSFDLRVWFAAEVARWVRETPSFFAVAEEQTPDGALLVTLRVRQVDEVLPWLLSWGQHMRVLAPDAARQRIAEESAQMAHQHEL